MSKLLERLRDPSRSGVYRSSDGKAILEATRGSGLDVVTIDMDPADPLGSIARALDFPDWFGANWDALEDCLSDLSWRRGDGHVLIFASIPDGDARRLLLDVLRSSAEYWRARGKPCFAVLLDPARKLELPDLYRAA
jgi:hypothetical protein